MSPREPSADLRHEKREASGVPTLVDGFQEVFLRSLSQSLNDADAFAKSGRRRSEPE